MTKPFPHDRGMTTRTVIIVPSTKHGNKPVSNKEFNSRVTETQNFMNARFGGSTTVKAAGSYTIRTRKGHPRLVKEKVVEVENFSTPRDWKAHRAEVEAFAEDKQQKWTQDSIGFEIQSPKTPLGLHFVKAHKNKRKLNEVV